MDILSYKLGKNSGGGSEEYFNSVNATGTDIKQFIIKTPVLDFTGKDSMQNCFKQCVNLVEIEGIENTNSITNMSFAFQSCYKLKTLPLFNTSKVKNMTWPFSDCQSLSNTSLDNVLQMCINAKAYTGTKTLANVGFSSSYQPVATIQSLPHYQDFIDAGWTIGY